MPLRSLAFDRAGGRRVAGKKKLEMIAVGVLEIVSFW